MPLYWNSPAFEVEVTIDRTARTSPIANGYRPEVKLEGNASLYPVYPDFLDDAGESIDRDAIVENPKRAIMHPLSEEVRELLRGRIKVGQVIALVEGSKRIGTATVTVLHDI